MSTAGLVTILFTDLVGSTALSQEIGDHAADDVRREHFEVLRQAVSRTGGTEVKTIGDALMVSYPAAADAVAGAVAMQQGVARHNRRGAGPRVEMRIGISAGDATFEDGDWFGTPVVEAARLCAAADGGQILATEIVRILGGTRLEHPLESVPPIVAKGITDPVTARSTSSLRSSATTSGYRRLLALPAPRPSSARSGSRPGRSTRSFHSGM